MTPWRELYQQALDRLGDYQVARWFLEEASGGTWPAVLDEPAPRRAREALLSFISRREAGEPVQYVLGHWSFRHLDLMVDQRVLVPRPETETVVELALAELAALGTVAPIVVDLGTGSGAIALSVLTEHGSARVWATDLSEDALAVASANLAGLGSTAAGRAHLVRGDWWEALPAELKGSVDLAVTNPPYVAGRDLADLPPEVARWEPLAALVPGPTGLEALGAILTGAPDWLGPSASLVSEIAPNQAADAAELARRSGFPDVSVHLDLAGRPRVLVARCR